MFYKVKKCVQCNIDYSFRNYTRCSTSQSFLYPASIKLTFLATSLETCFEIKLLKYFNEQIIRNGVTFDGFSDSYNNLYREEGNFRPLDRRRLSEAWYSYNIKRYLYQFSSSFEIIDFKCDGKSTELLIGNNFSSWKDAQTIKWFRLHNLHCKCLNCDSTCLYYFYC